MVSTLLIAILVIAAVLIAFSLVKKLFKLAVIVGAIALGVWLGLTLYNGGG